MKVRLLTESARSLQSYTRFLRRFGLTDIETKDPSPGLQRIRDEVTKVEEQANQLNELAAEQLRVCSFCGQKPAPHRITRPTPEQQEANQTWLDSLKEGSHTGHCPHLELPTFACQACYDAHPETHLPDVV